MAEPLTDADLERLAKENAERRKRKEAATDGPWRSEPVGGEHYRHRSNVQAAPVAEYYKSGKSKGKLRRLREIFVCVDALGFGACQYYDAAFIAAVRNDDPEDAIDALIAEVKRLRSAGDELHAVARRAVGRPDAKHDAELEEAADRYALAVNGVIPSAALKAQRRTVEGVKA